MSDPEISVIIVHYHAEELLGACLASLQEHARERSFEVLIADNGSDRPRLLEVLARFPEARLIETGGNVGFAAGNNACASFARGRYLLLLNPDTELQNDALAVLAETLEQNPALGAAGALLLTRESEPAASWGYFPTLWNRRLLALGLYRLLPRVVSRLSVVTPQADEFRPRLVDFACGAALMIRREAWAQVGALDPGYFAYYEETDWCLRAWRAGWQVLHQPRARVVHHVASSFGKLPALKPIEISLASERRYFTKHHGAAAAEQVRRLNSLYFRRRRLQARLTGNQELRAHCTAVLELLGR